MDTATKNGIALQEQVSISGKVVGRAYTVPMSYDILLPNGQLVRGVPSDCVTHIPSKVPESDVA